MTILRVEAGPNEAMDVLLVGVLIFWVVARPGLGERARGMCQG